MSVIIPWCTSCKHFKDINGNFCCDAFPNGIPDEYFWLSVDVRRIDFCNNAIGFEKIEDEEDVIK